MNQRAHKLAMFVLARLASRFRFSEIYPSVKLNPNTKISAPFPPMTLLLFLAFG